MNPSRFARLERLERVVSPRRHLVLYEDVDCAGLFRDPAGAAYEADRDGAIREVGGGVIDAHPLIVVRYGAKGRDSPAL